MLNPKNIISEINKTSKNYFTESSFYLKEQSLFRYYSTGDHTSKAINHNKNSHEEINVIKWFDDFWVYMEISFKRAEDDVIKSFFSLSVFEGSVKDDIKNQLFRAEWDSFKDNLIHPQPHWHFYSNGMIENIVKDFSVVVNKEQSAFLNMIYEEKIKGFEINKMHFALGALWKENIYGHINDITEDIELINWYQGLLNHIKTQLEFVS